ncbi:hypothetical protein QJQ45_005126 [Haematococcus lacustris]|nr:hypothetical protein QJQ45_005126 [Haematococcus lacustris]
MAFIAMDDAYEGPASPAPPRPTPPHASCNASGNAARLELLASWLEPEYAVGMGLKMDRFAPDLTADPVAWWRRYGSELPHLQVVAQRVLSIPPTSAATERLFSAFKII